MSKPKRTNKCLFGGLAAFCLASPMPAAADDAAIDIDAALGAWSRDMRLPEDDGVAAAAFTTNAYWAPVSSAALEAEVFAIASTGGRGGRGRVDVRKGFFMLDAGRVSVRAGRQVEVWGRADRLNPTDNLSPRDFTTLSTSDEDQRLGLAIARADLAISDAIRLSAYWVPEFRPNELLLRAPDDFATDRRNWDLKQFAAKLDKSGGAVDWSVSYYEGRDRIYDLAPQSSALAVHYSRMRVYGADLATNLGPFGFRAEAAYFDTKFDGVENPLVRRPEFWAVAGLDRPFGGDTYINVQASFRRVFDFGDSIASELAPARARIDTLRFQQKKVQAGMTLNLRRSWDDKRWTAEITALHYFDREQGLARIELRHPISPSITLHGRIQQFYGESGSYFERVSPASSVSFEIRAAI